MTRGIRVDDLTAQERIELIGKLWDSLDSAAAAADVAPEAGDAWSDIRDELGKKLG